MGFSPIWSRPEWMICQNLAIPPPAVRPSVQHDANQRSEDDLSHIIITIIKANNTLKKKIEEGDPAIIKDWTSVLQYYIATMVDNKIPGCAPVAQRSGRTLKSIKERLVGKTGRVRGNLMGKRVDFSSRSVITPDARIGIQELGVPMKIAMNITFPEKVNERNIEYLTMLVMKNGANKYPGAKTLEKKCGNLISLKYVNTDIIQVEIGDIVHRHLKDGDPILFNRQPTLHRMSMMCHYVKIMTEGDTFRMNVADTKPYNADFDGDEMNMHCPQDYESAIELCELANVSKHIISPADSKSIIGIFQDSLLATYRMTRDNITFDKKMLAIEFYRNGYGKHFIKNKYNEYCTMTMGTPICNIKVQSKWNKNETYVRWCKLIELHQKLFNETPNNLHNSLIDILICFRCYYKMYNGKDILTIDPILNNIYNNFK